MASHPAIINLTSGELTPQLDARIDLAKYQNGCKTMENFRPLPWGGATFRPGMPMIAETKLSSTRMSRLVPFNFSTTDSFVIEMGHLYMRFYSGQLGAQIVAGSTVTAWMTSTPYIVGNYVTNSGVTYLCLIAHTSGTFATDLANGDWVAQTIYEIATPFQEADLFQIQTKEINDVIYFAHPNYAPQKLSRFADDNWAIAAVAWGWPAVLDQNITTTTITPLPVGTTAWVTSHAYVVGNYVTHAGLLYICATSHTSGTFATDLAAGKWTLISTLAAGLSLTLTASANLFNASQVGGYFEIDYLFNAQDTGISLATNGTTNTVPVVGPWTLTTTGTWTGVLYVNRSLDGGNTYTQIRAYSGAANLNISDGGTEPSPEAGLPYALYTLQFVSTSGTGIADLRTQDQLMQGFVQITAYASPTSVTASVISPLFTYTATPLWNEGAWSVYRGYPRAVGLFEQRLLFAGTAHQPTTVWGSQVDDFEFFQLSDADTGGLSYQLAVAQQNPIQWLEAITSIHAGTSGDEQALSSGSNGDALTPTNVTARTTSNFGSDYLQPVLVERKILFIERQGRRLREMGELFIYANPDTVLVPDLTLLAEHITQGGITQMDFAHLPDPLVYCVRADGQMAVLTYNREQQIQAWARFTTQGLFESVACIYDQPQDQVWAIVNRTIGGVTHRFVERFVSFFNPVDQTPTAVALTGTVQLPCLSSAGMGLCNCALSNQQVITIGGDPNKTYRINIRVAAVAETNGYTGGAQLNGWYAGGASQGNQNNIYSLAVSNPPQLYQLNPGSNTAAMQAWDYTNTILVNGGATLTLLANSQDSVQVSNAGNTTATSPVYGITQPFAGQFVQIQISGLSDPTIAPVPNNTIFFLDCGQAFSYQTPTTTVTGLAYLNGCAVMVLQDGIVSGPYTVSGGQITLGVAAMQVNVGLPYVGTLETMKLDVSGQNGTTQGRKKRITKMSVRLKDTIGGQFLTPWNPQSATEAINPLANGAPAPAGLFTGEVRLSWPGNNEDYVTVAIQQNTPQPMTVIALLPQMDTFGE